MSFSDFNLKKEFIKSIEAAGYKEPTLLQTQLIPLVAERKSALISSQSASGKTGAFLIPAMNYILENPAPEKRGARILILTSRRDRVSQINYTIKRLSTDLVMRFGFIVSGRPYQTQMRLMRRPLDIMIATPGRLNDLMNNGKADFSQLEMLIIDDLSSIYKKNLQGLIEKILEQAGSECSSVTFVRGDDGTKSYAQSLFPEAIQINLDNEDDTAEHSSIINHNKKQTTTKPKHQPVKINTENLIPQKVHIADDYTHKIAMMDHLMDEFAGEPTLIYSATNKSAKTLQDNLSNHGHTAELAHELNPEELDECDIIIVSDQAKTSIPKDILSKIDTHIINFDLPHKTENYLNRISQHQQRDEATLLMIDGYNFNELKHLEKTLGIKLDQITIPGLEPLKPFVNLSKSRPAKRQNNKPNKNTKSKNTRGKNTPKNNTDNNQRRQRKGPFGRLNGGTHRKKSSNRPGGRKVGVSSVGTNAPKSDRSWQSDFAEPKERTVERSRPVAIRYSKKRLLKDSDRHEEKPKDDA